MKAETAIKDAEEIARYALNEALSDGSNFQGSQGYDNYFSPMDHEVQAAKKVMQAIYDNRLDAEDENGYKFTVKCGSDQDE